MTKTTEISPIFENTLFNNEQITKLNNARPNIEHAIETVTMYRTPTLLRASVLNDVEHPTPDSKYWQLVNEMVAHSTGLMDTLFQIEEKQIDIDEALYLLESESNTFEIRRLELNIRKYKYELTMLQKAAFARIEELNNQSAMMEDLKPQCKFGIVDQNAHQLSAFAMAWTSEVCNITEHTSVDDRRNITSRWITLMNLLNEMGQQTNFMNSLPKTTLEKLAELNLIKLSHEEIIDDN